MDLTSASSPALLLLIGGSILLWVVYGAVWRLYLSPLAQFPGPKIAALTYWYEFYYDVMLPGGGLFLWKIEELHKQYGPILRINPGQLHISDAEFHKNIYSGSTTQRDKLYWHVRSTNSTSAVGFTVDHDAHRIRRKAIDEFFTKPKIAKLEPLMREKAERMIHRIRAFVGKSEPVNFTVAYLAMAMDVITMYGLSVDYGLLEQEDFNNTDWKETIHSLMKSLSLVSHLGETMVEILKLFPDFVNRTLFPDVFAVLTYKNWIGVKIQEVTSRRGIYANDSKDPSVMELLRDHSKLPPSERTSPRLADEATILLVAGSETPAKVLAIIHYHLLANPAYYGRLRQEIADVAPSDGSLPPLAQLEKLPFLTAVVKEGLRLHSGVIGRSPRVSPNAPLVYSQKDKDIIIPPGTPVSMSSYFVHYDPSIYPEPRAFRPERWLSPQNAPAGKQPDLEKFFIPFNRGTRICLGYHFGYAIMYIAIAAVVSRYDMELKDTDLSDVDLERDWFVPQPRWGSQGVQARITRCVSDLPL